jgi:hypothetical protein
MKTWILAASFCLLTSLSASAGTYICDLATSGQSGMIVELPSADSGSEATLQLSGQRAVQATVSRSFNPYFIVLEIAPGQSLSGKAYLERAVLDYGNGELILGSDSFACRLNAT